MTSLSNGYKTPGHSISRNILALDQSHFIHFHNYDIGENYKHPVHLYCFGVTLYEFDIKKKFWAQYKFFLEFVQYQLQLYVLVQSALARNGQLEEFANICKV